MDKLGDKENKCEDEEAEESVAYNFTDNVAIKDAHGAKGECNMGEEDITCRLGLRMPENSKQRSGGGEHTQE